MAYVIYTARRSLAPGHVVDVAYTLPIILTRADRRSDADVRRQRSLSGRTETLFYGNAVTWDIAVAPVRYALVPLYREFLDSTIDGQTFQFNPFSNLETEDLDVIRDDDGYNDQRTVQTGAGHTKDLFTFQFRVREL